MLRSIRFALAAVLCWAGGARAEIRVATDFEGASANEIEIDQQRGLIRLTPGGDPARGWNCWWAIRVDGITPGQTIEVEVRASELPTRNNGGLTQRPLDANWALPDQASVSHDGRTWGHTDAGTRSGRQSRYSFEATGDRAWVAWGPILTTEHATRLLVEVVEKVEQAKVIELAKTREGRTVAALHFAPQSNQAKRPAIWIQARQHAWESGSSWVARGVLEWLASDEASAQKLREAAEIVVVPIMDVDNVSTGNGGKEADPRDHNRDWSDTPVYPEVAAAQEWMLQWAAEDRLALFVDLHNPSSNDRRPFFFCGPPELLSDVGRDNRTMFLAIAEKHIRDPLPVESRPRVTGANYHPLWRQISGQWVNDHGNDGTVAVCLETAWNTPQSTADGYRIVGQQLATTIAEFMQRVP